MRLFPFFVLWQVEERLETLGLLGVGPLPNLNYWGDELLEKVWNPQERGELHLKEVDEETLDMTTVKILICHDHQMAVSKALGVGVDLFVLEAQELLDVLNFLVLH